MIVGRRKLEMKAMSKEELSWAVYAEYLFQMYTEWTGSKLLMLRMCDTKMEIAEEYEDEERHRKLREIRDKELRKRK